MVKKIIYKLLCNKITGGIIAFIFRNRIPDLRWKGYSFSVKGAGVSKTIIASIFWGFYESAEIRFAQKYFKGDTDILEFGSSCGIVASHFASKLKENKKYIAVEANNGLLEVLKNNLLHYKTDGTEIIILNNALYYGAENVSFLVSNNTTESHIVNGQNLTGTTVEIPAITLTHIVDRYHLANYTIVCDIEGAEVEILLNETETLNFCRYLFIELHSVQYAETVYTIDSLKNLIESKGFILKDQHGPVCYFEKEN